MIQFKIAEQTLTIEEARLFVKDLESRIRKAERRAMRGIQLVDGKYIDRENMYDFFRQSVPPAAVRNRAGKLFAPIVRSSIPFYRRGLPSLPLNVVCANCKRPLRESEVCDASQTSSGHKYYRNDHGYLIDVASLIEYEDHFLKGGSHQLSGKKLSDFKHLMMALREVY